MTSKDTMATDSKVMVDITRLSKTYTPNINALADISLQVETGEMLFLTGMSGAGKTTLLRLICGIEQPTKGFVEVDGNDLNKISKSRLQKLRRRIGVAYQNFKLLPDRTVAQNIAISMEVAYRSRLFIRKQTNDLLAQLNLADKHSIRTSKLSRGEQQRVAIARAVANQPDLILADEPTGNLDAETTGLVMDLFHRCNLEGTTLLIATHDQSIYEQPNTKVVRLGHGKMVEDGQEFNDDPASMDHGALDGELA